MCHLVYGDTEDADDGDHDGVNGALLADLLRLARVKEQHHQIEGNAQE